MFLVGAEDVFDQELVLGQPLPGDGHQFRESQSVSTTHRMQLRILTTAVCVCVCRNSKRGMDMFQGKARFRTRVCVHHQILCFVPLTRMKVLNFSFFLLQSLIKLSAFTYQTKHEQDQEVSSHL